MKTLKLTEAIIYKSSIIDIFRQIGIANNDEYTNDFLIEEYEKMILNLEMDKCIVFVEIENDILKGLIWSYELNKEDIHLSFIGVDEIYRGNCIGSKLLNNCFKYYEKNVHTFSLFVNKKNKHAISFYKNYGFMIEKEEKDQLFLKKRIQFKTPYYLIDSDELTKNLTQLKCAMQENFNKFIIGYSYKTNSLPWIISKMKELDCYAEVVSMDEYALAKQLGYTDKIIYNGPMKDKKSFLNAIKDGAIINIETNREIAWLKELPSDKEFEVGVRINFDIEALCPKESACGDAGGRFGFCIENQEFAQALKKIYIYSNIKVTGIHLHTSSKTRGINIYKAIAKTAVSIIIQYDLHLKYIDIGGGFFGGMPTKPSFQEYMKEIKNELSQIDRINDITIIVEPGAAIIASPISFYTSVIDIKKTNRNLFITTDGSRNDIDPLMQKKNYLYEIVRNKDRYETLIDKQIISGYTCMENDRLFELMNYTQLNEGDVILYKKVGSYTMCLSPLFIKYFPDVYVKEGQGIRKIREKWEVEDYMQKSVML